MLEVIDKGSMSESHPVPLLFVHGAAHAAWCWDEHFLDYFANRGYRAVALSLRGHGGSPTPKPLHGCSIADYVEDVRTVASGLPIRPVMIGHSTGGFLVQKYLEDGDAPGGVLLASIPPGGAGRFAFRMARRLPWLTMKAAITRNSLCLINTPPLARRAFFSAQTPERDVARYAAMLGEASDRALLDMVVLDRLRPMSVTTPMLVLGAECDGSITQAEVHDTARAYSTEAEIFPGLGHDMMLEPGWQAVAARIDGWLATHGL